jgi:hypothetical protein
MRLQPFVSVDGDSFMSTRDDVLREHGVPAREYRNEIGLTELDYQQVVFRFEDCGRLEEITMQAPVLDLGSLAIPFAHLEAFIREQDPAAFERAGFIVSPAYGVAFDPTEPCWVTALAKHCLAQWEAL